MTAYPTLRIDIDELPLLALPLPDGSRTFCAPISGGYAEIDLRDGQADGKMTPRPKKCPKCDAMMSPKFGRCLFCGENDQASRTP